METIQDRIRSIISSYKGERVDSTKIPNWIIDAVLYTIKYDRITNMKEWKKYFKVVQADPSKIYSGCFCDGVKKGKQLGTGFFGEVYGIKYTCANYPGRLSAKIEPIKLNYIDEFQMPDQVHKSIQISNKAAKLGVGPHIYETFLCVHENNITIIKIMELIEGVAMDSVVWKSRKHSDHAEKMVLDNLKLLNRHGIIHNDIHPGNIMIKLKNGYAEKITFIDFDRASLNVEADLLKKQYQLSKDYQLCYFVASKL